MIETNKIYYQDCLEGLKLLPDKCIDLIITDPPYLIHNTRAGGNSRLAHSIQPVNDLLKGNNLNTGIDLSILPEMVRVMKRINCYIWWKTNPPPLYNNKYLCDKEYCLYFRKRGYCQPTSYESSKTVFHQPINVKDKKLYPHPTIKPVNIIKTLINNSSKLGDIILDPFLGSGTTAVACMELDRRYIGYEINQTYYEIVLKRIADVSAAI